MVRSMGLLIDIGVLGAILFLVQTCYHSGDYLGEILTLLPAFLHRKKLGMAMDTPLRERALNRAPLVYGLEHVQKFCFAHTPPELNVRRFGGRSVSICAACLSACLLRKMECNGIGS